MENQYYIALYPNFDNCRIIKRDIRQDYNNYKTCHSKRNVYYKIPNWIVKMFNIIVYVRTRNNRR